MCFGVIMPTPLFPVDAQGKPAHITIQQGETGDCYLLASLDCLLNAEPGGRDLVAKMFTQNKDGSVTVRIKQNAHSKHLKADVLTQRGYKYRKDANGDDLITVPGHILEKIDNNQQGVKSNSLAVKILERISSYYFVADWDAGAYMASVLAHNVGNKHEGHGTEFVAGLLGIKSRLFVNHNGLHQLIKLKLKDPNKPVYLSIDYGLPDASGVIHGRHALRIEKIIHNGGSDFTLVLVNPWNNQQREEYSLAEIVKRNPKGCIFDLGQNVPQPQPVPQQVQPVVTVLREQNEFIIHAFWALVQLERADLIKEMLIKFSDSEPLLDEVKKFALKMIKSKPSEFKNAFINLLPVNVKLLLAKEAQKLIAQVDTFQAIVEAESEFAEYCLKFKLHAVEDTLKLLIPDYVSKIDEKIAQLRKVNGVAAIKLMLQYPEIKMQIISFMVTGDLQVITRRNGLRNFVSSNASQDQINKLLPVDEFISIAKKLTFSQVEIGNLKINYPAYAAALNALNPAPKRTLSEDIGYLIESRQTEKLVQLLQKVFASPRQKDVQAIITTFSLEQLDDLLTTMAVSDDSPFKKWFIHLLPLNLQRHIASKAEIQVEEIITLSANFQDIDNVEAVGKRRAELLSKLNTLFLDSQMKNAENTLMHMQKHIQIDIKDTAQFAAEKSEEIKRKARERIRELRSLKIQSSMFSPKSGQSSPRVEEEDNESLSDIPEGPESPSSSRSQSVESSPSSILGNMKDYYTYYVDVKDTEGGRETHFWNEAKGSVLGGKYQDDHGDYLKSRILDEFKTRLEKCTAGNLEDTIGRIEDSNEYKKVIARSQGFITSFFGPTDSVKAFEKMANKMREELGLSKENSNKL